MRWKITIGCLLLLSGVGIFVYGATRNAVNIRISQKMESELRTMFMDDNAPISVRHDHKELRRPIGRLMRTLYDFDGNDCWGVGALKVCFVGVVLVFLGVISIRSDVLKRCVPAASQTLDIAAVRTAGNAVFLFRIVFVLCFATAPTIVGNNCCNYWYHFLQSRPLPFLELACQCAYVCTRLAQSWLLGPTAAVLLALMFIDRLVYMRVLKSGRRGWRWLWEIPIDWCLGIMFLSFFFFVLYAHLLGLRQFDSTVFELICPSEEVKAEETQIADIISNAGMPYSSRRWEFSREEALAIPEWPEWKDWVKVHKDNLPEKMTKLSVRCRKKDKSACERLLRDYLHHYNESQKAVTHDKLMDGDKK